MLIVKAFAARPFPGLFPQLAPGWGTAREVLKVKSAFARPHLVELRWGRTTSLRFLRGGGSPLERVGQLCSAAPAEEYGSRQQNVVTAFG